MSHGASVPSPGAWSQALVPAVPYLWLGVLLPRAVPDRSQDQPLRPGRRAAALQARLRLERYLRLLQRARFREFRAAGRGRSLFPGDAVVRAHRRRLDSAAAARRLSHRLCAWPARRSAARSLLVALIILPFWTSFLIRIYAWIAILKPEGLLNQALMGLGLISEPARHPQHRDGGLSSASSMPICPSWCCRSTRRWRRWTIR